MPWGRADVHSPADTPHGVGTGPGTASAAGFVVAEASASCTNSPPIVFICSCADTSLHVSEVLR